MRYLIIIAIVLGFTLSCCESETESNDPFSCEVTLQNSAGEPLQGYLVQLTSYNMYLEEDRPSRPEITITFSLERAIYTQIVMRDYWGTFVDTLLSETMCAGTHHIPWNCRDYFDNLVLHGVYKYTLTVWHGGESTSSTPVLLYLQYPIDFDLPGTYKTTAAGTVFFSNIIVLPGLYCTEDIAIFDEMGEITGYYDFSSSNYIIVKSPDDEIRYTMRDFTDEKNSITIVWEEMTPIE